MSGGVRKTGSDGRVTGPRPASAWVMAVVASATLWITGELSPWIIPVQLAAYAVSYRTRSDPPAWQRSPIWLNVGMFGITGVTIAKAVAGSSAALSLAHFSALSQGLQLLDARPRRSEFLLVALALFQVILAANLTDSVFFPPLLIVFLVSVTWTLLVHTLRIEAAQAGDATDFRRAITPGLVRTTAIACLVSIGLGLITFTVLPRIRSNLLRGAAGGSMAVAGFSDRVALGTIGRIRQDDSVVLRVTPLDGELPDPANAYWRGLAFDKFDGRSWSISIFPGQLSRQHVNGSPRFGVELRGGPRDGALKQRIVREPVQAGVLFGAGPIVRVEGPLDRLQLDPNGGLYHPTRPNNRIRYTVWTRPQPTADSDLRRDHTAPPRESGPASQARTERYLELPVFDDRIAALAREITAGLTTDADRVRAIEQYLRKQGRYTNDPPPLGAGGVRSPVEDFLLGELEGHCEYFASAMVVLGRSLGIPTRLVNGFAGGRINRLGGFVELTRSDAHAWVEVRFARAGWTRYDPTPPDLRLRVAGALSLGERIAELGSVIELWWFQRVVDFDSADQILAIKSAWHIMKGLIERDPAEPTPARPRREGWHPRGGAARPIAIGFALSGAAGVGALLWRTRRRRAQPGPPRTYRRALRLLARRGLRRGPATTARAFVAELEAKMPGVVCERFARITDAYLAQRFGARGAATAEPGIERDLLELERLLSGRGAIQSAP